MKKKNSETAADKAIDDLRALVTDAESLLSNVGDAADDKITELRARMRTALDEGLSAYDQMRSKVGDVASEKIDEAEDFVRERPYHAVGIAAGFGLLLGLLIARRD